MALSICETTSSVLIAAGYESGHTMLYSGLLSESQWVTLYSSQPHSQPSKLPSRLSHTAQRLLTSITVLSLSSFVKSMSTYYLTSSPLPMTQSQNTPSSAHLRQQRFHWTLLSKKSTPSIQANRTSQFGPTARSLRLLAGILGLEYIHVRR